jgi:MFS family permease
MMADRGPRIPLIFAGAAFTFSCLVLAYASAAPPWVLLAAAYAVFGAGYGAVNIVISAVAIAGMPRAQAGVAGGITSAGRQAGQSLGVSVAGAILADRLHGTMRAGLAVASHPAWLVIAASGVAVLLLSVVSTSRPAIRTAARAAGPAADLATDPATATSGVPALGASRATEPRPG